MKKRILRVALIGAGKFGRSFHLNHILQHEGFELAAIMDANEALLGELHQQYQVPVFTDLNELLAQVKPDLCAISSPTQLHASQAIACMEAGSDVFLEKPIGMTWEEGEKIRIRRDELGRKVMVHQPHRIRCETLAAEEIIASGKLGNIFMIKRNFSYYFRRDHWQGYKKNGGGNLANHGAHYIDQLLHLSGGKPASAAAVLRPIITTGDADDMARAIITTDHGITLDLEINFASAFPYNQLEILGTNGAASLGVHENGKFFYRIRYFDPRAWDLNNQNIPFQEEVMDLSQRDNGDYYDHCYAYYAENQAPLVPVEETLLTMKAIDMCRAASGEY